MGIFKSFRKIAHGILKNVPGVNVAYNLADTGLRSTGILATINGALAPNRQGGLEGYNLPQLSTPINKTLIAPPHTLQMADGSFSLKLWFTNLWQKIKYYWATSKGIVIGVVLTLIIGIGFLFYNGLGGSLFSKKPRRRR